MLSVAMLALQLAGTAEVAQLDDARRAQRAFESMRRMHLPRVLETGSHPCDIRAGRFCYWHAPGDSIREPEPRIIAEARAALLQVLGEAGDVWPDNPWIAGQRVRYLLESGAHPQALRVADACRADAWWCAALRGLALHDGGRDLAADSAFSAALAIMNEEQRCKWLDVSMLSGDRLPCPERAAAAELVWVMGQPLWSRPARDFRSEFLSRRAMAEIMEESANPHGLSWGNDNTELLLRYGWAQWYSRERSVGVSVYDAEAVRAHHGEPSIAILPEAPLDADSLPLPDEDWWSLDRPAAAARYAPRYLTTLLPLPHQIARFPRGDSTLIVASYSLADSALAGDSLSVRLVSYDGAALHRSTPDRNMILSRLPVIASLEVSGSQTRRAARARVAVHALDCPRVACLSDLLLYQTDSAVGSIAEALDSASGTLEFPTHRALGALWELRGLPSGTRARVTLTLEPRNAGLIRRLGMRLGLVRGSAAMRLRWETVARPGAELHSVALALPPGARGPHVVIVEVEPMTAVAAPAMSSRREIILTAPAFGVSRR